MQCNVVTPEFEPGPILFQIRNSWAGGVSKNACETFEYDNTCTSTSTSARTVS